MTGLPEKRGTLEFMQLKPGKKAQLTVFIIIGLVMIVAAGIGIYITSSSIKMEENRAAIPPSQRPVYDFVVSCAQQLSREAINLIGQQGGYLNIPNFIATNPAGYVLADPAGVVKVPYWYYHEEDRSPPIGNIEFDISTFIRQNLRQCLDNFASFPQYNITEVAGTNISVKTTLADENVAIELSYPIDVASAEKTERLENYAIFVPVRLKKMYELGTKLMQQENEQMFFEKKTVDWIASDPNTPLDVLELNCNQKRWSAVDVQQELQNMVKAIVPYIWVENTASPPFLYADSTYAPFTQYSSRDFAPTELGGLGRAIPDESKVPADLIEHNALMFNIGQPSTDLKASFDYQPDWGLDMSVQPNDNGILKSNIGKINKLIPIGCINQAHFTYDVNYPVVMRIRDDSAFDKNGFIFQFAFPVLVHNNEGNRAPVTTHRFEPVGFADDFCATPGSTIARIRAQGYEGMGWPIFLEDVQISYRCFSQLCSLGSTRSNPETGVRELVAALPEGCTNGFIVAEKDGYLPSEKQLTTDALRQDYFVVPMTGIKTMNVKVVKHTYYVPAGTDALSGAFQTTGAIELGEKDNAAITLTARGKNFEQRIGYPNQTTIQVIDDTANYGVNIMLTLFDKIIGGYDAENIQFSYSDIAGADTIVFHVFSYIPWENSDQYYTNVVNVLYNGNYQQQLKPTFETTGAVIE